ncbi:MAG: hypothetical protein WCS96_09895 [Victivallales bacterium]
MKLFFCSIYFLSLLTALEIRSAELLPPPFQLPKTPDSKIVLNPQINNERPYFDADGKARVDINLYTHQIIPNCLLTVSLGRDLSFFPVEQYRIYFPNHQKGVKDYVLVRISDQKILFNHKTDERYNIFFQSWNCPNFFIKRKETRLAVTDYRRRMEYLFSTFDSGYTWMLDEMRDIDFNDRSLKLEYNDKDLLKSIILPDSSKYIIEYNSLGLVSKVSDPDGAFTSVTWDDKCQPRQIKTCIPPEHPLYQRDKTTARSVKPAPITVKTLNTECDSSGKLLSLSNSSGEKYTVEYRSDKNETEGSSYFCAAMKNPDNTQEFCKVIWRQEKKEGGKKAEPKTLEISSGSLTYDVKGKEIFETLETRVYEKKGNAYTETSGEVRGVKSNIKYNPDGTASDFTNSKGETTKYSHNEKGDRTGVTYPDGSSGGSQRYDDNYRLVMETDEKGVETRYSHDKLGHLVEVTESGLVTKYQYDAENKLPVKTILPDGSFHSFSWDRLFRMTSHTLPDGSILNYEYAGHSDKLTGILAASSDGKTVETKKFAYTPAGMLEKIIFPDGKSEKYQYKGGSLIKYEDRSGKVTSYTYDSRLRKTSEQTSAGEKNFFKYDTRGNLVSVQLSGKNYQDEYDSNGRLIKRTNPDKSWVTFSYDELGVKVKERYSDRTETAFKYDVRGRIVSISGNHSDNISHVYNDKGLLVSTTVVMIGDPNKKELTTAYSHDERGRKIKTVFPDGSEERTTYLDNNDIIKVSNGMIVYLKHDSCGRISAVSEYSQGLFEKAETKEEKRKVFEENMVRKYAYNLFGEPLGDENIAKKRNSL